MVCQCKACPFLFFFLINYNTVLGSKTIRDPKQPHPNVHLLDLEPSFISHDLHQHFSHIFRVESKIEVII